MYLTRFLSSATSVLSNTLADCTTDIRLGYIGCFLVEVWFICLLIKVALLNVAEFSCFMSVLFLEGVNGYSKSASSRAYSAASFANWAASARSLLVLFCTGLIICFGMHSGIGFSTNKFIWVLLTWIIGCSFSVLRLDFDFDLGVVDCWICLNVGDDFIVLRGLGLITFRDEALEFVDDVCCDLRFRIC